MTNVDLKSLEIVFSIGICRQLVDKWQSKTLFLTIVKSIVILDSRLSSVMLSLFNLSSYNTDLDITGQFCVSQIFLTCNFTKELQVWSFTIK